MAAKTWMPFYFGDYLADTSRLTMLEHGAYLLLMADYWNRGPLPTDSEQCYCIARATDPKQKAAVDSVLKQYFDKKGAQYRHKRIDKERASADEAYEKRVRAAKKRWKQPSNAGSNADAKQDAKHRVPADAKHEQPQPHSLPKGRERRATKRVPADWMPDDSHQRIADEEGADLAAELAIFRDHEFPKAKSDWDATFRNWLRRAKTFGGKNEAGRKLSAVERVEQQARRNAEQETR